MASPQVAETKPTFIEAAIWAAIKDRKGKAKAVGAAALAQAVGAPPDVIAAAVKSLILRFARPIGSAPEGYYRCNTAAERYENHLKFVKLGMEAFRLARVFAPAEPAKAKGDAQ